MDIDLQSQEKAAAETAAGEVEHGLFPPDMVTMALIGRNGQVDTLTFLSG